MPSERQSVQTRTNSSPVSGQGRYALLTLRGREPSGDRLHPRRPEYLAQVAGDVIRRVDEPAEDDRVETVLQEGLDLANGSLELSIRARFDGLGAAGEPQQPAAGALGVLLRLRAGAEVQGRGIVVVGLVQDSPAPDFVHVFCFRFVRC